MNRIVCTEQFSTRVMIMDADAGDWNKKEAIQWTFDPMYHKEIRDDQLRHFRAFSDVKPVLNMSHLLITASCGAICLVRLEDSKIIFCGYAEGNAHSAELLEDGNIVSASSSGSFLRLFRVRENETTDYELIDAHGIVWDRKRKCLWSSSLYGITRWTYDGKNLKRQESYNPLSDGGKIYGHDLFPVYGADKLYMTGEAICVFDPERCVFESIENSTPESKHSKSIGRNQDGKILVTYPNESWWTDTVSLYDNGTFTPYRTRKNMWFYKARWMMPNPFSYNE